MLETRKKILCIEDDRETAVLIAEDLIDRGYDVILAHNGEEGLMAILRDRPDLVLCDVHLPLLSGFEIAERLASRAPNPGGLPFVFLTAVSDQGSQSEARKRGTYVSKPIDFDRLGMVIDARLAGLSCPEISSKLIGPNEVKTLT